MTPILPVRRPITAEDLPFLMQVYASTRQEELAVVPWSEAEKDVFLRMQFQAQHAHYQQHYLGAEFSVLEMEEEAIGRLYLHRRADQIRIVDIALLPAYRGRGIGRALLEDLIREADASGLPLGIHVERENPAMRLYSRLGFVPCGEVGVYLYLERPPA